ncbi:unnamed protein product [Euphydryas editha]|uniref:Uncharacterized protein n=1 Tax=Euphydryas editha TaxID=104508 RepID=A0AAU9TP46_EUPED|nr:unnamed protein product [Euphydryas editha]
MPLTSAERQKLYRQRLKEKNPEKFLLQKRKNAERTKQNRKKITEYAPSEQENIRKQWRDRKKKNKQQQTSEVVPSVEHAQVSKQNRNNNRRVIYKLKIENNELKEKVKKFNQLFKNIKQKLNRSVQKNNELLKTVKEKNKLIRDLKENSNSSAKTINDDLEKMTPSSKTNAYIHQHLPNIRPEEKERVKKALLEHHVIVESIKESYKNKKNQEKRLIKNVFSKSDTIHRYNMKTKIATYLGLKGKIRHHAPQKNKSSLIQAHLRAFYERDDVSKMTAGKNEIKTQRKQKKQRRYLLGTLRKLHQKYIHEGGKLSFATFKRYRPFYVLPPKAEKRDTCACKRHENLQMKATVLEATGLIGTKDLDELLGMVVCDIKSKKCAYGECELCKNKCVNFTIRDKKANDSISWYEWVLKPHEYKPKRNSDVTKTMKKISKEKKTGTLEILMEAFQEELQNFKTHSYNIIHQYQEYRRCTKNLDEHTVALHIDFSENYTCKLSTEIQAMHFDGSRQQISLHTGIMYSTNGNQSFASMSPNKEHGPDAIWAHLLPVLELIKRKMPKPRTAKEPLMEWGGAIKRRLDSFVAYGSDIPDAKTAYELLQASETEIQLFYIPDDAVLNESVNLVPVPNTMKIHQIIINVDSANSIFDRYLSCFCQKSRPGFCNGLNVKSADLLKPIVVKNEKSITPKKR